MAHSVEANRITKMCSHCIEAIEELNRDLRDCRCNHALPKIEPRVLTPGKWKGASDRESAVSSEEDVRRRRKSSRKRSSDSGRESDSKQSVTIQTSEEKKRKKKSPKRSSSSGRKDSKEKKPKEEKKKKSKKKSRRKSESKSRSSRTSTSGKSDTEGEYDDESDDSEGRKRYREQRTVSTMKSEKDPPPKIIIPKYQAYNMASEPGRKESVSDVLYKERPEILTCGLVEKHKIIQVREKYVEKVPSPTTTCTCCKGCIDDRGNPETLICHCGPKDEPVVEEPKYRGQTTIVNESPEAMVLYQRCNSRR